MSTNPYEPPTTQPQKPDRAKARRTVLIVVLGMLTLPASCIAFFASCATTLIATDLKASETLALGMGGFAALLTAAVMIYFIVRLKR